MDNKENESNIWTRMSRKYKPEEIPPRKCSEVARQLYKLKVNKLSDKYKKSCDLLGLTEYASLIEFNIANSARCDNKCTYCVHVNEAGF